MPNSDDKDNADWFLNEWMAEKGVKQPGMALRAGWSNRKVSFLCSGRQPYKRFDINQAASALGIEPYELLLPPAEAMALRQLRQSAVQIAAATRAENDE
ncbi:MAG: hypothetical protein AAFP79_05100 [Pseudomonadota bacterium]